MANEMVKEGGVWRFRNQPKFYEEASYDLLPSGVENGSQAITKNNNSRWVYCAVAGCWVPEQFYDPGLAIQQDRSGTPKDIDFRTPQISDFSGLSGYFFSSNPSGASLTDGTNEIILTANSGKGRLAFTRETHTGDTMLIVDLDFQVSSGASTYETVIYFQNHTSTSHKTVNLCPIGVDKNTSNEIILVENGSALGTAMRPITGFSINAGDRVFMKFNSGELVTASADKFVEVIGQDKSSDLKIRAPYNDLGTQGFGSIHYINIISLKGVFKIKRFQLLKYT